MSGSDWLPQRVVTLEHSPGLSLVRDTSPGPLIGCHWQEDNINSRKLSISTYDIWFPHQFRKKIFVINTQRIYLWCTFWNFMAWSLLEKIVTYYLYPFITLLARNVFMQLLFIRLQILNRSTMSLIIQITWSLVIVMTGLSCSEPLLVETLTGEQEDLCSIYPRCQDHGPGTHEIQEDCQRYFECELLGDGTYIQRNMTCLDVSQVRSLQSRDSDLAPECTEFKNLKCKDNNDDNIYKQAWQQSVNKKLYLKCILLTNIYIIEIRL